MCWCEWFVYSSGCGFAGADWAYPSKDPNWQDYGLTRRPLLSRPWMLASRPYDQAAPLVSLSFSSFIPQFLNPHQAIRMGWCTHAGYVPSGAGDPWVAAISAAQNEHKMLFAF